MTLIEQIRRDREAGTDGPWMAGHFADDTHSCNCRSILGEHGGFGALAVMEVDNGLRVGEGGNDAPDLEQSKANARRIARVPEMEAALIACMDIARLAYTGDATAREIADEIKALLEAQP